MPKKKKKTREDIEKEKARIELLLEMAWSTSSEDRMWAIASQILEINPDRVEALLLEADNTDNPEFAINYLKDASYALGDPDNYAEGDKDLLFLTINQRLAFHYLSLGDFDNAFKAAETAVRFAEKHADDEYIYDEANNTLMKAVYYRILIEHRDWQRILTESMRDADVTLGRAYARLIASWFVTSKRDKNLCAGLFWDTLAIAPDVPFYILSYFDEPDDNAPSEAVEDFHFALMYYDTVTITEEFFNWFSRGVILFGLLSGRFDGREESYVLDVLDRLGGFDDYEKMKNILLGTEDSEVIEALAANKCLVD